MKKRRTSEEMGDSAKDIDTLTDRLMKEAGSIKRRFKTGATSIHVTALDSVLSVNSFFTVAVFLGLSLTAPQPITSLVEGCKAGPDTQKLLLLYEVLAFSCFLFSTLMAHGLKLLVIFANSKDSENAGAARLNTKYLRFGMLACAAGSVAGTIFLLLSMINIVELKFGPLHCPSGNFWTERTVTPMILLVGSGVFVFISSVVYEFLH